MFSFWRSSVAEFSETEYIFQRLTAVGYQEGQSATENAQKMAEQIKIPERLPEQSVNRGRFGKPVDVLFPSWCSHGVVGFQRRCLPEQVSAEASSSKKKIKNPPAVFSLRIEHSPDWFNYAHSDIYTEKNGSRLKPNAKIGRSARKLMREHIASDTSTQMIHEPIPKRFAWLRRRLGL